MKIKTIFFDFGGTLDSDGIHWRKRFYDIYTRNGINMDYDSFSNAFFDSDDNLHIRHNLKGIGFDETIKLQVKDVLNYLKINNEEIEKKISDEFIQSSRKKIDENRKILEVLKSKGHTLAIISNFYGNLDSVIRSLGIDKYFSFIADSGVIGHTKPDKEIFLAAINNTNADINISAMVGDTIDRDIKGAHNIGIYHFYLTNDNNVDKCCNRMFIINSLKDLLDYV